jgi:hypothetical protein
MKGKWSLGRKIAVSVLLLVAVTGVVLYSNFNKIVAEAVRYAFNSNIVSNVYELRFEKLRVNLFKGDVRVVDVVLQPREDGMKNYPYINSTIELRAKEIRLIDVQLLELLRSGRIKLKEIAVSRPDIVLTVSGAQPIMFPFTDSSATDPTGEEKKKAFEAFSLARFRLEEAGIRVSNSYKEREASIIDFNVALDELFISQKPDTNFFSFTRVDLSIGEVTRLNKKGPLKHASLNDFTIGVDSMRLQSTKDTLTYSVSDLRTGFRNLDIHTADSLFHITVGSYNSSYKQGRVKLEKVSFAPNITREAMQARFKYQNVQASGKIESLELRGFDHNALIYDHKLLIDSILIGKPELAVFKDKTKPIDSARIPAYLGQQIAAIKLPLRIRNVIVSDVNLLNVERKPDSTYAQATIERGTVRLSNVTNLSKATPLALSVDAYLAGKIRFDLKLDFSYVKPEFAFSGKLHKFDLPDLNPLLSAYTPATISAGVAEDMTFAGTATWTGSTGTMKFLYHDLAIELALKEQAKWKSSLIAFAANTIVHTSNPGSSNGLPREVKLRADRDMNKGFVNIVLKSLLNGVKESLLMSKENRAAYQAEKKRKRRDS